MGAIKECKLNPETRNEIVRDLVTHMYGYMEKPNASFCNFVAQRLVRQYPFMRDAKGSGHVNYIVASYPIIIFTTLTNCLHNIPFCRTLRL